MAEVGLLDVEVDLWQLVRHFRWVFPAVTISEPKVVLEKNAEGAANWDFRASTAMTAARAGKAHRISSRKKAYDQSAARFFSMIGPAKRKRI